MDNSKAKLILSVYRANGLDAQDPMFSEALKQAESDPELRAWLGDQRATDAQIAAALAGISGPAEGKAMIATTRVAPRGRRLAWAWPLALAASVAIFFAVRSGLQNRGSLALPENATLAELATNLSEHHASIGLMSKDYSKLRTWIAEKGGPLPEHLPPALEKMAVLGCETWKTSRGKVSLVCFVGDDMKMVHLYVFDQTPAALDGAKLPELPQPRFERSGNWALAVWKDAGRAYVLGMPVEPGQPPNIEKFFRA
ncbi:MAG: hypothetical protein HZA93_25810 [Verrucomicrobia bacterium]|nr:hypothetical protein [Verrucomicrobiota bacterium]